MLEPKRMEVDCVFVCPACSCETWYTIRELKHRKYLDCLCGTKTRIKPVQAVEVVYASNVTSSFDESGHNQDICGRIQGRETRTTGKSDPNPVVIGHADFVNTLVHLGHKRSEAKRIVDFHIGEYDGNDENFLTLLLQGMT
jgi:hypothetical protein